MFQFTDLFQELTDLKYQGVLLAVFGALQIDRAYCVTCMQSPGVLGNEEKKLLLWQIGGTAESYACQNREQNGERAEETTQDS